MNENKKGSTLYVVLGVATLVVAIIGATFAYFSAQASTKDGDISGGTSDVGAALSLNVTRDLVEASSEEGTTVNYNNLVPAEISNETDIKNAIDNKCIGTSGYVGCHVYKIEAGSSEALTSASIRLADLQTTATDYASWKFYLYKLDESGNVTIISDAKNTNHSFAAYDAESTSRVYTYSAGTPSGFDMHNNASLNGNTVTVKPGTTAGKAIITVTTEETINYTSKTATYEATVNNGSINLRVTPYTGTYDGRQHNAVTVNVTPSDAKIEYSINGGTYSTTMPTVTNTSSFTVTVQASKAGYKTQTTTETVKVNKANGNLTLSATSGTIAYPNSTSFTVSNNTGSLSVSSSNSNIATVSGNVLPSAFCTTFFSVLNSIFSRSYS